MLKVGELKEIKVMLLDDDGNPTSGTISYVVYNAADVSFSSGTMTVIAGVTGFYTMVFTPNSAGEWTVKFSCSTPNRTAIKVFDVGKGVEQDIYDTLILLNDITAGDVWTHGTRTLTDPNNYKANVSALALEATLGTHDSDIKALLSTIQADLDSPNQYKANVSALALEATLTAIKGGGWTTETLKVIKDAIDALTDASASDVWNHGTRTLTDPDSYKADVSALALEATLNTHDSDIKTLIATVQADLDSPSQYRTDVSSLALEATLATHDTDIKALIGSPAADLAADIAAIKTVVDTIAGYLDTEIGDIKTETDKIPTVLTDTADIQPRVPRIVCKMDFKSLPLQITLTSTAGDRGLVDIVVSGLPAGVTIIAVEGIFYCDTVENSFDGENYLESTKIQVKEKTAGTDRDAITLEANKIFRFTDDMVRGGTVLTPDWATATAVGILAEVIGNATYQMWFDVGETKENNIVLDGAVFMLRIWFSI